MATWNDRRFESSGGNLIYYGKTVKSVDANTSKKEWYIWKFTWDSDDNLARVQGPILGAWSERTTLGW